MVAMDHITLNSQATVAQPSAAADGQTPTLRVPHRYSRSRRIAWLIEHRDLWREVVNRQSLIKPQSQRKWREIVRRMQTDGVVQPTTHWSDVNLVSLIAEARKELRGFRHS